MTLFKLILDVCRVLEGENVTTVFLVSMLSHFAESVTVIGMVLQRKFVMYKLDIVSVR